MNKILEALKKDEFMYLNGNCFGESFDKEPFSVHVCDQCGQFNGVLEEGMFSDFVKIQLVQEIKYSMYDFAEENKYTLKEDDGSISIEKEKIKELIPKILLDESFLGEDCVLSMEIYGENSIVEFRKLPLTLIVDSLQEVLTSYSERLN